jgi:type II secretory pathway component GspD/PulD (secretin)
MKQSIQSISGQCPNKFKHMKRKLWILTLVGTVAWSFAAVAQNNPPAGELPTPSASVTTTNDTAPPAAEAKEAPAPAAATNVTLLAAADTAAPAAPAAAEHAAAANPDPGAIIPLIVMDDVPLTDAIKNLARQAGLNHILDPKVSFGQPGPDGKAVPQPSVSIRWENVTAAQALNTLLSTYQLQLVEDPKSKIARVTVKDPAAPDPLATKVFQLKWASPTNVMAALVNSLADKRSKVVSDVRSSQLVVLATEKEMVEVEQLVLQLDTRTKQVLIEARLLETQMTPGSDKGVDWSGTLAKQNVVFGNTLNTVRPVGGMLSMSPNVGSFFNPSTFFLNADGVKAAISFLNTYGETKVISSPRTVTMDNEMAVIESGTMYPIINTTAGTANTTGGSSVSYSNLTVRLDVTPRISANDYVNLKVIPRVTKLGKPVASVVGGVNNVVDSFDTSQMQTSVLIPSGNTLVMGGLISDNININNNKVPMLGDIPGLGYLFRWDSKKREKRNLTVFITPTIVGDEDFQPTKTDYLKTPVPTSDSVDGDWSSWDSGKPHDWSKAGKSDASKYANVPGVTEPEKAAKATKAPKAAKAAKPTPAPAATEQTAASKFSDVPGVTEQ